MPKKQTEPGYYWATGPKWLLHPSRMIVRVSANRCRDSTCPDESIVQMIGDTAPYSISDFSDYAGPLPEPGEQP